MSVCNTLAPLLFPPLPPTPINVEVELKWHICYVVNEVCIYGEELIEMGAVAPNGVRVKNTFAYGRR